MKRYKKPNIHSYTTDYIIEHIGPVQNNYFQVHYIQTDVGGPTAIKENFSFYRDETKATKFVRAQVVNDKIVIS